MCPVNLFGFLWPSSPWLASQLGIASEWSIPPSCSSFSPRSCLSLLNTFATYFTFFLSRGRRRTGRGLPCDQVRGREGTLALQRAAVHGPRHLPRRPIPHCSADTSPCRCGGSIYHLVDATSGLNSQTKNLTLRLGLSSYSICPVLIQLLPRCRPLDDGHASSVRLLIRATTSVGKCPFKTVHLNGRLTKESVLEVRPLNDFTSSQRSLDAGLPPVPLYRTLRQARSDTKQMNQDHESLHSLRRLRTVALVMTAYR